MLLHDVKNIKNGRIISRQRELVLDADYKNYYDVGRDVGLSGRQLDNYVNYMRERWPNKENSPAELEGYCKEWARRFLKGDAWKLSDLSGQRILERMGITDSKTKDAKSAIVNVRGDDYDIEIMDGTHLKFKLKGTTGWATPLHFNQVSDEMMDELKKKGLVRGNFFVEDFKSTKDQIAELESQKEEAKKKGYGTDAYDAQIKSLQKDAKVGEKYHVEEYSPNDFYVENPVGGDSTGPFKTKQEAQKECDKRNLSSDILTQDPKTKDVAIAMSKAGKSKDRKMKDAELNYQIRAEGRRAFRNGETKENNPYKNDSAEKRQTWIYGFEEAEIEKLQRILERMEITDSKTRDATTFSKGDKIVANQSVQGMSRGASYTIVDLEEHHSGLWGTFVAYKLQDVSGNTFWVNNLHVLATKDSKSTKDQIAELESQKEEAKKKGYGTDAYDAKIKSLQKDEDKRFCPSCGKEVEVEGKLDAIGLHNRCMECGKVLDSADESDVFTQDPLTEKGKEILAAMKEQYGEEKGERVFYASKNKGTISGVDSYDPTQPKNISAAKKLSVAQGKAASDSKTKDYKPTINFIGGKYKVKNEEGDYVGTYTKESDAKRHLDVLIARWEKQGKTKDDLEEEIKKMAREKADRPFNDDGTIRTPQQAQLAYEQWYKIIKSRYKNDSRYKDSDIIINVVENPNEEVESEEEAFDLVHYNGYNIKLVKETGEFDIYDVGGAMIGHTATLELAKLFVDNKGNAIIG